MTKFEYGSLHNNVLGSWLILNIYCCSLEILLFSTSPILGFQEHKVWLLCDIQYSNFAIFQNLFMRYQGHNTMEPVSTGQGIITQNR